MFPQKSYILESISYFRAQIDFQLNANIQNTVSVISDNS